MMTLTLQVHDVADRWPDADTDVLIFYPAHPQAQLGAYMGHDVDGAPIWVDAQGGEVVGVTRWAELPVLAHKLATGDTAPAGQQVAQRQVA